MKFIRFILLFLLCCSFSAKASTVWWAASNFLNGLQLTNQWQVQPYKNSVGVGTGYFATGPPFRLSTTNGFFTNWFAPGLYTATVLPNQGQPWYSPTPILFAVPNDSAVYNLLALTPNPSLAALSFVSQITSTNGSVIINPGTGIGSVDLSVTLTSGGGGGAVSGSVGINVSTNVVGTNVAYGLSVVAPVLTNAETLPSQFDSTLAVEGLLSALAGLSVTGSETVSGNLTAVNVTATNMFAGSFVGSGGGLLAGTINPNAVTVVGQHYYFLQDVPGSPEMSAWGINGVALTNLTLANINVAGGAQNQIIIVGPGGYLIPSSFVIGSFSNINIYTQTNYGPIWWTNMANSSGGEITGNSHFYYKDEYGTIYKTGSNGLFSIIQTNGNYITNFGGNILISGGLTSSANTNTANQNTMTWRDAGGGEQPLIVTGSGGSYANGTLTLTGGGGGGGAGDIAGGTAFLVNGTVKVTVGASVDVETNNGTNINLTLYSLNPPFSTNSVGSITNVVTGVNGSFYISYGPGMTNQVGWNLHSTNAAPSSGGGIPNPFLATLTNAWLEGISYFWGRSGTNSGTNLAFSTEGMTNNTPTLNTLWKFGTNSIVNASNFIGSGFIDGVLANSGFIWTDGSGLFKNGTLGSGLVLNTNTGVLTATNAASSSPSAPPSAPLAAYVANTFYTNTSSNFESVTLGYALTNSSSSCGGAMLMVNWADGNGLRKIPLTNDNVLGGVSMAAVSFNVPTNGWWMFTNTGPTGTGSAITTNITSQLSGLGGGGGGGGGSGVTQAVGGTAIGVTPSGGTGVVTFNNTGVTSISATSPLSASASTGAVALTLTYTPSSPQQMQLLPNGANAYVIQGQVYPTNLIWISFTNATMTNATLIFTNIAATDEFKVEIDTTNWIPPTWIVAFPNGSTTNLAYGAGRINPVGTNGVFFLYVHGRDGSNAIAILEGPECYLNSTNSLPLR